MIYRIRIPRAPDEWVISSGGVFLPGAYATEAAARWAFRFTYEQLRHTRDRVRPRAITTQDLRETRDGLALPRAKEADRG